ncbi:MTOR-associated protein MEAK7-like [Glandiceps talaboti]
MPVDFTVSIYQFITFVILLLVLKSSSRGQSRDGEFEKCFELFTNEERKEMQRVFSRITSTNDPKGHQQIKQAFNLQSLQSYIGEKVGDEDIVERLYNDMLHPKDVGKKGVTVGFEQFVITMAHLLKGTLDEQADLLMKLASDEKDAASAKDMYLFVSDMVRHVQLQLLPVIEAKGWDLASSDSPDRRFAKHLLRDLFWKDGQQPVGDLTGGGRRGSIAGLDVPIKKYVLDDILAWLIVRPRMPSVIAEVFRYALDIHQEKILDSMRASGKDKDLTYTYKELASMVPRCKDVTFSWHKLQPILDIPSILFLNSILPKRLKSEWRLLFSSRLHGESFNTMAQNIVHQGPSIVLVKDRDGHIFGGFATDAWEAQAHFYGTARDFLFSLNPIMEVYEATGDNNRYQYFNLQKTTLPSGLGFGGHFEYFGLWIDANFGSGYCMKSSTYDNEQMSFDEQFKIDSVEVWGVGPPPKPEYEDEEPRYGSVLDADPEASAILELTGSYRMSDGFRNASGHSPGLKDLPLI